MILLHLNDDDTKVAALVSHLYKPLPDEVNIYPSYTTQANTSGAFTYLDVNEVPSN